MNLVDRGVAAAGGLVARLRRPGRRERLRDALLWAVLAAPVLLGLIGGGAPGDRPWWAQLLGVLALGAAIGVCRAWPPAALIAVLVLLPLHGNFVFGLPVVSYLAGRRGPHARPVLWVFGGTLVLGSLYNTLRGEDVTSWFPQTIWLVVLGVLPWLVGRYWRQYQELVHAGWERAEHLEREQRIVAEQERLRERSRIAQDMHDSLGHELALIAVRAGALQVAPGLEPGHREAAAQLRAGAAAATDRLREIIGVLREDADAPDGAAGAAGSGGEAPIRPARESVAELVARARASGVPVTLEDDTATATDTGIGTGAGEAGAPGPMADLAVHRVVQEALTNAAKHAPGAAVTVRLSRSGDGTRVAVENPAPPEGPRLLPSGGGRGLTGLAERVRLAGGTLRAGPAGRGGFAVVAELPDAAPPAGAAPAAPDASESSLRLQRQRRQVRRVLITTIVVPAGLVAVLSAVMAGYYVYVVFTSVLSPRDYARLRVGQPRAEVERVLPPRQLMSSDIDRVRALDPPGTRCRFYRSDADLLGRGEVFRVCFAGDRLARKDVYRAPLGGGGADGGG